MTKEAKISFDGKKLKLKTHSYRAIFMYEEMTGKSITDMSTFKAQVTYFYCLLKASNDDEVFDYTLDGFIDKLEEDDEIMAYFTKLAEDSKKK